MQQEPLDKRTKKIDLSHHVRLLSRIGLVVRSTARFVYEGGKPSYMANP